MRDIECFNAIINHEAFKDASKEEVLGVVSKLSQMKENLLKSADPMARQKFNAMASKFLNEQRIEAVRLRRTALTNLRTIENAMSMVTQERFKGRPIEALKAYFGGGTTEYAKGGNRSVRMDENYLAKQGITALEQQIKGFEADLKAGVHDLEILKELEALQNGKPLGSTGSKAAAHLAPIIRNTLEHFLKLKRLVGSPIEKLDGYLIAQSHDGEIVGKLTAKEWIAKIKPELDLEKSFKGLSGAEIDQALTETHTKIALGKYGSSIEEGVADQLLTVSGLSPDIGKRAARERRLHFKDAESFYRYNKEFGKGNVLETVISSIRRSAQDIAIMNSFTTNPEGFRAGLIRRLENHYTKLGDKASLEQLKSGRWQADMVFDEATKRTSVPGTGIVARYGAAARSWQHVTKMGRALFSSVSDLAYAAGAIRSMDGSNFFVNATNLTREYLANFTSKAEAQKSAALLAQWADDTISELYGVVGSEASQPGVLSKGVMLYNKLTLLPRHVLAAKNATAKLVATHLAEFADKGFGDLSDRLRLGLQRYGIEAHDWEILRRSLEEWEGQGGKRSLMTPEGVAKVPREIIENQLLKAGVITGDTKHLGDVVERYALDLQMKLSSVLTDHANMGSSTPNVRNMAFLHMGTKDEGIGSALRMITQFKSATLSTFDTGRRILKSNPETMPINANPLKGDIAGLVQTGLAAMALATVSRAAWELALGKTPSDPLSKDNIQDSFVRSGMGGLMADFLLSEAGRSGKEALVQTAAGPTLGAAFDAGGIFKDAISSKGKVNKGDVFRLLMNNVPGQNLFFLKGALNHYLTNGIQESLSHGYLRRLEDRVRQTPGLLDKRQEHIFFKPSESTRAFR